MEREREHEESGPLRNIVVEKNAQGCAIEYERTCRRVGSWSIKDPET